MTASPCCLWSRSCNSRLVHFHCGSAWLIWAKLPAGLSWVVPPCTGLQWLSIVLIREDGTHCACIIGFGQVKGALAPDQVASPRMTSRN